MWLRKDLFLDLSDTVFPDAYMRIDREEMHTINIDEWVVAFPVSIRENYDVRLLKSQEKKPLKVINVRTFPYLSDKTQEENDEIEANIQANKPKDSYRCCFNHAFDYETLLSTIASNLATHSYSDSVKLAIIEQMYTHLKSEEDFSWIDTSGAVDHP